MVVLLKLFLRSKLMLIHVFTSIISVIEIIKAESIKNAYCQITGIY